MSTAVPVVRPTVEAPQNHRRVEEREPNSNGRESSPRRNGRSSRPMNASSEPDHPPNQTAPATAVAPRIDPISSGEIRTIDVPRSLEVQRRHNLISDFLAGNGYDGVLIQRPSNFAWLTAGADNTRRGTSEITAAIFVTHDGRVMLCQNVDSAQLFDRELNGMGFQLKERPWTEAREQLLKDLCRGRHTASDIEFPGSDFVEPELAKLRRSLSEYDRVQYRQLAGMVAHAVEAVARTCEPGQTEEEVAGQIAHRLMRRGVQPVRVQAITGANTRRYRHWTYGPDKIEKFAVVSAVGRSRGMHALCTRMVAFGKPSKELQEAYQHAVQIQGTGMFFTQAGWDFLESWKRVQRIYEKLGRDDDWRVCDQAEITGYENMEVPLTPRSFHRLAEWTAINWHPVVGSVHLGDSSIIHPQGLEWVTHSKEWPQVEVQVKGVRIRRPALLNRGMASEWAID